MVAMQMTYYHGSQHIIYLLSDPRTGEPRYIGQSSVWMVRPYDHFCKKRVRAQVDHCHNWIRGLLVTGLHPVVEILEEIPDRSDVKSLLDDAERFWIASFRLAGAALTNMTDGGDGVRLIGSDNGMFGRRHRPDSIEKMSLAQTGEKSHCWGIPKSAETARKIGASQRKRVVCLDDGSVFADVRSAAEFYNISYASVAKVCRRESESSCGLRFAYAPARSKLLVSSTPATRAGNPIARRGKPVICLDDGRVFQSQQAAKDEYTGLTSLSVSRACRSGRPVKGLRFAFAPKDPGS